MGNAPAAERQDALLRQQAKRRRDEWKQRCEQREREAIERNEKRLLAAKARNLELIDAWEAKQNGTKPDNSETSAMDASEGPDAATDESTTMVTTPRRPQTAPNAFWRSGLGSAANATRWREGVMASLLLDDLVSLTRRLGGKELGDFVQNSPPPVLPVPTASLEEMRHWNPSSTPLHISSISKAREERLAVCRVCLVARDQLARSERQPIEAKARILLTIEQYGSGGSALRKAIAHAKDGRRTAGRTLAARMRARPSW